MVEMMRAQGFHPYGENGFKDPMEYTHGYRFFDFFAANDEHKQAFDDYMAARRAGTQLQWFDIYPAEAHIDEKRLHSAENVLVCDVGGGQGHEIVKFRERYPDTVGRLVLQDLARSFQGISLPAGIEAMPHDFFKPQPIKGKPPSSWGAESCSEDVELMLFCRSTDILHAPNNARLDRR